MSIKSHLCSQTSDEYEWMFMCLVRNIYDAQYIRCWWCFLPSILKVKFSMQNRFTLNSMSLSRELCINVYNLEHLCVLCIRCGRQFEPLCHSQYHSMHMWYTKVYVFMKMHKWRCKKGSINTFKEPNLSTMLCSALRKTQCAGMHEIILPAYLMAYIQQLRVKTIKILLLSTLHRLFPGHFQCGKVCCKNANSAFVLHSTPSYVTMHFRLVQEHFSHKMQYHQTTRLW